MMAPKLTLETVGSDCNCLRSELTALYRDYEEEVVRATILIAEYEEILRDACKQARAARKRSRKIKSVLDAEFPGWDGGLRIAACG